jgi:uncharacterized protein YhbP (UPF0306 family)
MSVETATRIIAFLDAHHVMSLATCGPEGAHAANVFYVRDGFALIWSSDPESRHSADLEADAGVAATVAPDYFDLDEIRGVQISGHAHAIIGRAPRTNAQLLLEARYPYLRRLTQEPSSLRDAYIKMKLYRLEPTRMVLIDNSRGFGHKDTLDFEKFFGQSKKGLPDNTAVSPCGGGDAMSVGMAQAPARSSSRRSTARHIRRGSSMQQYPEFSVAFEALRR